MSWVRLDDGMPDHPKLVGLSDGAFRLHVHATCWCSRHRTDGFVLMAALSAIYARTPRRFARELVAAGVWHETGHDCDACPPVPPDSFYVHDFLEYNPSAEEQADGQARRSERARRAAAARWSRHARQDATSNAQSNASSIDASNAQSNASELLVNAPSPTPISNSSHSVVLDGYPQPVETVENQDLFDAVINRIVGTKLRGRKPKNQSQYEARVRRDAILTHGDRIADLCRRFPRAPADAIAGHVLGEPNSLAHYARTEETR